MHTNMLPSALLLVLVAALGAAPAQAEQKGRRMTADAVKQKGLTLQKTLDVDLDGDNRKEVVGVATGPKGVQLVLVGEEAAGAVVTQVAPPAVGKEIAKVEVKHLVGPPSAAQVLLEVYDETPDEKVKRIRIYGADGTGAAVKLKEIFSSKVERARNSEDRPAWETDESVVKYGDPRAGWYFEDLQDDGLVEILVRRNSGAQIISIDRAGGAPVKVMTGVRETVFSWDSEKGVYSKGQEQLNDFLPAHAVAAVDASSAWVAPKELKELKSRALSEALNQAAGTGDKKSKKELSDDIKIDLQPYIKPVADGNLGTAWIEGDEKGDGKGEWVEVTLEEEDAIHMVRLVLGCVETRGSFKGHNIPESFTITLDNGAAREVDRRQPGKFDPSIVAFSDNIIKLADRPWARTTLVFLDGKTEAKKVRVTLGKAAKQGRGNQTCISELSVH